LISPLNTVVSDGFFETMGIEVVQGRSFNTGDVDGAAPVAIIDEELAARFFQGRDPIGARITQGVPGLGQDDQLEWRTIVGVVGRVRTVGPAGEQPPGHYYVPLAQSPSGRLYLALKTGVEPLSLENTLRAAVAELDPDMPAYSIRTMEERVSQSLATERMRMMLLTGFGGLALFLAAIGLYGVLAYSVAQRSAEIGIRMALGSSAAHVFRMVVGQGARLVVIGLALGALASVALARLVQGMLFGVSPTEPAVFGAVLVLLSVTALVACVVPARRAMSVDPMVAMRDG
ncbi:MAG TPA: FtsX-like permease family protein, partial [Longimicrobiales bacterium]|nr:FtsX-like permease family protein [Longimicrobiales bacterium]